MKIKQLLIITFFILSANSKLISQQTQTISAGSEYDLVYHRLELTVDPNISFINGKITTYFKPVKNTNNLSFDLADKMTVDSVVYHKKIQTYTHSQNVVKIRLKNEIIKGLLDSISVFYSGNPISSNGLGSFVKSSHKGTPIMWTLSAPYGAKDWWACKQTLYDKADSIDLIVIHPKGYKVAANGVLISETEHNNKIHTHWKHRHSIAEYLIAFAITNYKVYSDYVPIKNNDSIQVLNYVYPENNTAPKQTPAVIDIMQLYNRLFIPYPFKDEKYGHAQFNWGGGMEHQTMSFMLVFDFRLIAHELAHQWFGNYITCGSWKDVWLNEGFARYCELLNYENGLGSEDAINWKKNTISHITYKPYGSVYVDDTTNVNRIFSSRLTYEKGAMFINMLRWEIGDSAFFAGVRNYLTDKRLINGFAKTEDFKKHVEKTSKQDLNYLFDNWIYGQGFPSYTISWVQNKSKQLYIEISQQTSHESVDFFRQKVPIHLVGEEKDTILVFDNTHNNEEFAVEVDFDVKNIVFDPNKCLIAGKSKIKKNISLVSNDIMVSTNQTFSKMKIVCPKKCSFKYINIHNLSGKQIKQFGKINEKKKLSFDIKEIEKGVYFVVFCAEKNICIKKLLII